MVHGRRYTIAFASHLLLLRERAYSVTERETLSIVWALSRWRVYLLGRPFTVLTDHRACTYLNSCRLLSPRISRWALALQEYDFQVEYVTGAENTVPDVLSRSPPVRLPVPPGRCFQICGTTIRLPRLFSATLRSLPQERRTDPKLARLREGVETNPEDNPRFFLYQDLLFTRRADDERPLLCVPLSRVEDFVLVFHECLGHFGVFKTWAALKREVWWQNMHRDVKRLLKSCDLCQRAKVTVLTKPPLSTILPDGPGDLLSVDVFPSHGVVLRTFWLPWTCSLSTFGCIR